MIFVLSLGKQSEYLTINVYNEYNDACCSYLYYDGELTSVSSRCDYSPEHIMCYLQ
jgi:hypothetical protein